MFESYTQESSRRALIRMGHDVTVKKYYTPKDYYKDDDLSDKLYSNAAGRYDIVFTVNFWPLVARAAHELSIPYVSWVYDSPMNLKSDDDMEYDTNFIFLFDRGECDAYNKRGISRVFHMPLATDTNLWDRVIAPSEPEYDVSYMGNIYESTFPQIHARLDKNAQGFWNGVIKSQLKIFGYYFADELITDERLEQVRNALIKSGAGDITRRQFAYSLGSYLAYQDRVMLLGVLSKRVATTFATFDMPERLREVMPDLNILPSLEYETQMPAFFKSTKVNINSSLRMIRTGIPLRALDIMGAGGFLLSDVKEELMEYFVHGEEIEIYDSVETATEKCLYYVNKDDKRKSIAKAGYEKVKKAFSYEGQLGKMLEKVFPGYGR